MRTFNKEIDTFFENDSERNYALYKNQAHYTPWKISVDELNTLLMKNRINELCSGGYKRYLLLYATDEEILSDICNRFIPIIESCLSLIERKNQSLMQPEYYKKARAPWETPSKIKETLSNLDLSEYPFLKEIANTKFFEEESFLKKRDISDDITALLFFSQIKRHMPLSLKVNGFLENDVKNLLNIASYFYGRYLDSYHDKGNDPLYARCDIFQKQAMKIKIIPHDTYFETKSEELPPYKSEHLKEMGITYGRKYPIDEDAFIQMIDSYILLFDKIDFSSEGGADIFYNLVQNNYQFAKIFYFRDCKIGGLNYLGCKTINYDIFFQNCDFYENFKLSNHLSHALEFEKCSFYGQVDFNKNQVYGNNLWFNSCIFEKGSKLIINDLKSNKKNGAVIHFNNTTFKGELYAQDILKTENISMVFNAVSFIGNFSFKSCHFAKGSTFFDIAFGNGLSEFRNTMAEQMGISGFKQNAQELGIQTGTIQKKSNKFDMDAYQAAYATGYLNPDFASFLLDKSTSFLAKKRAKDRKTITKESLPFIVSGRDVQYPVEVLLAFKSHDWAKLKELRQKYPIPKDSD